MNKDITYYLPKFFETELRSNDNCSENTIISYKYAFILLLEFVKYKYKKNINNITLDMFNRKIIEEYLEYLEVVKKSSVNTRNQRLAAIKSFFKYLTYEDIKYLPIYNDLLLSPFPSLIKISNNSFAFFSIFSSVITTVVLAT